MADRQIPPQTRDLARPRAASCCRAAEGEGARQALAVSSPPFSRVSPALPAARCVMRIKQGTSTHSAQRKVVSRCAVLLLEKYATGCLQYGTKTKKIFKLEMRGEETRAVNVLRFCLER